MQFLSIFAGLLAASGVYAQTADTNLTAVHRNLFVTFPAKPTTVTNTTEFLQSAIPLVVAEPLTIQWYGVKFEDSTTFAIFDTSVSEEGRRAHLNGVVAGALFANAPVLFTDAPVIHPGDILASKVLSKPDNSSTTSGLSVGLAILFTAIPGQADATKKLLIDLFPLAKAEPLTLDWYAIEFPDTNSFAIIGFFADENGREADLNGKVVAKLFAEADTLFTTPPNVIKTEVVAVTLK
ncbi:Antibiotic biosynthesis monooxygenase [Mycena venus]|uniref:Antibiotic biosynthesis monooxygenase n=1 Tax=Mycena venus TaxID=2733690 RepID=A0A8H6YWA4_9AGAR|nr:Antibiotic biosynthesis monooxygenase [Mycena venus]